MRKCLKKGLIILNKKARDKKNGIEITHAGHTYRDALRTDAQPQQQDRKETRSEKGTNALRL